MPLGSYGTSRAIFRAVLSSKILVLDREPTYWVRSLFLRLTKLSHMIKLGCFSPSACSTGTWVERPSPVVKTGAQITVEKRDSMSTWRLTTTNTR